jgi:uncharacterized membrane protein
MIKTYLITFLVFIVIDLVWLGLVAKSMYRNHLGFIMSDSPNWIAALVFYALFIFGLVYFVINPAIENQSFTDALIRGLLFGLITYGTYDLTNLATLKDWPLKITIIDLTWGTFLGGSVSSLSYWLVNLFK